VKFGARAHYFLAAQLLEKGGDILGLVDSVKEAAEDLALDHPGGPDRNRWSSSSSLPEARLELKEPFEVLAVVVRSHGARDRPVDLCRRGS